jgi:hypothetical protein
MAAITTGSWAKAMWPGVNKFFGMNKKKAYVKASHVAKTQLGSIDVDSYDLTNGKEFIKCLSESGILHGITTYEFASRMIRLFGSNSLPMFEDGMRFMATMAGSSVLGTSLFPISLQRYKNLC